MSILNDNPLGKFQDFDIAMSAAAHGFISVDEYRKMFTNELLIDAASEDMCLIKFYSTEHNLWQYISFIESEVVEVINIIGKGPRFKYKKLLGWEASLYYQKFYLDKWYIIEPEYFEHVKSMIGSDNIIRL